MSKKAHKYLYDIQMAIQRVFEDHLEAVETPEAFLANVTVQRAVEREITIVGEALYRLRQMGMILPQADRMINRRNTIIHQYDDFNPANIWALIQGELPGLAEEVRTRLSSLEP